MKTVSLQKSKSPNRKSNLKNDIYMVLFFIISLILLRSSPNLFTALRIISISCSVHFLKSSMNFYKTPASFPSSRTSLHGISSTDAWKISTFVHSRCWQNSFLCPADNSDLIFFKWCMFDYAFFIPSSIGFLKKWEVMTLFIGFVRAEVFFFREI
jgi:hypothetical protein